MAASTNNTSDDAKIFCPCDDFLQFQDALKRMRTKDDFIIYNLNTTIPFAFQKNVNTTSQCKDLYEKMVANYEEREKAIQNCITQVSAEVAEWRVKRQKDMEDDDVICQLRKTQHKLRLMQKEIQVDEVVKNRSLKVFYERCRNAYTPPHRPIT